MQIKVTNTQIANSFTSVCDIDDLIHCLQEIKERRSSVQAERIQELMKSQGWDNLVKFDKINAIKMYRHASGCSLKEAKDAIDHYLIGVSV